MKNKNNLKALKLSQSTIDNAFDHVNPLRLVIDEEFNRPGTGNYRKRSIDRVMKAKASFQSEFNTIGELVDKLNLTIKCPNSGKTIKFRYTGGSGSEANLEAQGKDVTVRFSIPCEAIYVHFKDKE
jgi:hypothetical protein